MRWTEFTDRPELTRAQMIERELSQAPTADFIREHFTHVHIGG